MTSSLDQVGPVTKTVEDAAILFNAIAGRDPLDATSADHPFGADLLEPQWDRIKKLVIVCPMNILSRGPIRRSRRRSKA